MTKLAPLGGPHEALQNMVNEIGRQEEQSADAGSRIAADFLGKSKATFYKYLDAEVEGAELSFVRVAQLTGRYKVRAAAEHLARLIGCVLHEYRPEIHAETPLNALAHTVKETSEAVGAIADWAQHPAETTQTKRRSTVREIDQAIDALLEARARIAIPAEGGR